MTTAGVLLAAAIAVIALALGARRIRARLTRLGDVEGHDAVVHADAERLCGAVMELESGGAVVWDAAGRITSASNRACALFGFAPGALAGHNVSELLGEPGEIAATVLEPGQGERVLLFTGTRRDGVTLPLELRIRSVETSAGIQHAGVLRDTTDDVTLAAANRRSEVIRSLIDSLPDAVVVHRDGKLVYLNRRALDALGYDGPEEILGRSPLDIVHPDDDGLVRERMRRMAETGEPQPLTEERIVRRDGSILVMDVLAIPTLFDGAPATVVLGRNPAERRRLQARGALADRMASVGRLAAGVAHGINNPLAFVLANTEYSLEELGRLKFPDGLRPGVVEDMGRALTQAREGALRIRDLVADLATFSRSAERPSVALDLQSVLESSLSLAANEIRHRARIVRDYGPTPAVLADRSRLAHAFMNLLVNAAHAIPEGDAERNEIRVVTRTDEAGRAQVEIRDSGAGMAPDVVSSIFDPFFTTKPVGSGSGLGLSITHEIVTSLGGTIHAESELGRGSVFRISLPSTQVVAEAATGQRVLPAQPPPKPRVLVVDDEAPMLEMCERILAQSYEVRTARSGRSALERLEAGERFDVILCDLLMPDVTGMDLYETLRRTLPSAADKMIFVTGGAFTARAQDFMDSVSNLRLAKPFDREALLQVICDGLSR
jgi:PAS domain S-box-containing protein